MTLTRAQKAMIAKRKASPGHPARLAADALNAATADFNSRGDRNPRRADRRNPCTCGNNSGPHDLLCPRSGANF
jgi:hypothetical protein